LPRFFALGQLLVHVPPANLHEEPVVVGCGMGHPGTPNGQVVVVVVRIVVLVDEVEDVVEVVIVEVVDGSMVVVVIRIVVLVDEVEDVVEVVIVEVVDGSMVVFGYMVVGRGMGHPGTPNGQVVGFTGSLYPNQLPAITCELVPVSDESGAIKPTIRKIPMKASIKISNLDTI
jgi:hypothetical protein